MSTCDDIKNDTNIFFVENGKLFIWPTFEYGHKEILSHIETTNKKLIEIQTISQNPRVFHILNFFSDEEAEYMVKQALSATHDSFRLKRSSTGQNGYTVDMKRTSENAFDVNSEVSNHLMEI